MRSGMRARAAGLIVAAAGMAGPRVGLAQQAILPPGAAVPGIGPGVTVVSSAAPSIDGAGRVLCAVGLAGGSIVPLESDLALMLGAPGSEVVIARTFTDAPLAPAGTTFQRRAPGTPSFSGVAIDDNGDAVFLASIQGPIQFGFTGGVWIRRADATWQWLQTGTPAPGWPTAAVFTTFGPAVWLNNGRVAFVGSAGAQPGIADGQGIWSGPIDNLLLVQRRGDQAPGFPAGITLGQIGVRGIDESGSVLGVVSLAGPGITSSNDSSIWFGTPASYAMVLREGDQAPGLPAGVTIVSELVVGATPPTLNAQGRMALVVNLGGTSPPAQNAAIYVGVPGALGVLISKGDPAPDMGAGVTISGFLKPPVAIGRNGHLMFFATVAGPGITTNEVVCFAGQPGALRKVFQEGDAVASLGAGVNISGGQSGQNWKVAPDGRVAGFVVLTGPGVTAANNTAFMVERPGGGFDAIARRGSTVDLGAGGVRTIESDVTPAPTNADDGTGLCHTNAGFVFSLALSGATSSCFLAGVGPPPCVADMDDGSGSGTPDGGVTIEDLLFFLGLFDAGDARADVDDGSGTGTPDGGVTIEDLLYYLVRFDAGC